MSKRSIMDELADYFINCGQDSGEWCLDAMAEELDNMGYSSIDDIDEHEFTCFLEDWDGMVVNASGSMVNFEAAMHLADNDICEYLINSDMRDNQEFF